MGFVYLTEMAVWIRVHSVLASSALRINPLILESGSLCSIHRIQKTSSSSFISFCFESFTGFLLHHHHYHHQPPLLLIHCIQSCAEAGGRRGRHKHFLFSPMFSKLRVKLQGSPSSPPSFPSLPTSRGRSAPLPRKEVARVKELRDSEEERGEAQRLVKSPTAAYM
jgi:hypothetical protein